MLSLQIVYLCESHIHAEHENLLRVIDEAKLKYFSLSKEELVMRNKVLAQQAKVDNSQ